MLYVTAALSLCQPRLYVTIGSKFQMQPLDAMADRRCYRHWCFEQLVTE